MIVHFVVFNTGTGLAVRAGLVNAGDVAAQAGDNEISIERTDEMGDLAQWRWIDGTPLQVGEG